MSGRPNIDQVEQLRRDLQVQTDMHNKIGEIKVRQEKLAFELQSTEIKENKEE